MSPRVSGTLNRAVIVGGRIVSEGTAATAELLEAIPEREFWDGLTADEDAAGGSESTGPEAAYLAKKKDELELEVATRNEGRGDDTKIVVAEPGNKPELAKALVADDENAAGS